MCNPHVFIGHITQNRRAIDLRVVSLNTSAECEPKIDNIKY